MRFGFVTCVRLGLACLEEIYAIGGEVDAIFTLRDDIATGKSGRVFLDEFAEHHQAPLHKITNINDSATMEVICEADLDWLFIIGWSQIAGTEVLAAPRLGCIGMHPTLLPEGRGRASIPWAILKKFRETGVTAFKLDAGVDTGPILVQQRIPISRSETATSLYQRVAEAHKGLIGEVYGKLENGEHQFTPQDDSQASVWPGRRGDDGRILTSMTVDEIDLLVRAVTRPYPGAFIEAANGARTIIWAGSRSRGPRSMMAVEAADGTYWATEVERLDRSAV